MPTSAKVIPFMNVARVGRFERRDSALSYGQVTGSQLSSIIQDLERGECRDWAELCEHMVRTDTHLQSVYSTRRDRVSGAKWVIDPAKVEGADAQLLAREAARVVDKQLRDIDTLEQSFNRLLGGIGIGYGVGQLMWKPTLNEVVLTEIRWVHPRRFIFGQDYELMLTPDNAPNRGTPLPANKFVTHVPEELDGYPPLSGLFQSVAWYWLFKHWAIEWWLQAAERHGTPMTLGTVPPDTPKEVRDEFRAQLERYSADHVGVVEEGVLVEVNAAGAAAVSGEAPHKSFADSMDDAISKAILGMTDATGSDETGARAATETRKDLTIDPRMLKDGKKLWATFRRDVFEPILRFNPHLFGGRMPPVPMGRFVHRDVDFEITPEVQAAGVATPNQVRRAAGMPAVEGGVNDVPFMDHGKGKGLVGEGGGVDTDMDVQKSALTGQQVAAMQSVVRDVASGAMPRDSAVALIEASFPVNRLQADQIVGTAGVGLAPTSTDSGSPAGVASPAPPAGGQAPAAPFRRAKSRTTASSSSRTSRKPASPLATVLSGRSVDPASARHRQLSMPFKP